MARLFVLPSLILGIGLLLSPTGHAELVSFQPLPNVMCPLPDELDAFTSYAPADQGAVAAAVAQEARKPLQVNITPARYIKDPYPAWSAVAVNPENNMVVFTDENLHRIVEYNRTDNTPAGTAVTAPRREIGGLDTMAEMLCGVYIDPKTLEVRVTNNDTQDWLPMFSREARGNAKPDRFLATPHQTFGIGMDEIRQEMYLTVQGSSAVVVYKKDAQGYEAPLRVIQGGNTELADPHGIAVDTKHNVFVVANHGHRTGGGGGPTVFDPKEWEDVVRLNLFVTARVTHQVLPSMIKQRSGCIINLAGGGSAYPRKHFSAYACSKAAVLRFSDTLAEELWECGIRVNAITPGSQQSAIWRYALKAGERPPEQWADPEALVKLIRYVVSSPFLKGKFLHVEDDYERIDERIMASELYTLRRISPSGRTVIPPKTTAGVS